MLKSEMSTIEYRDVRLRPLTAADLAMTLEWRNRERARKWFKQSEVISPTAHEAWFARYMTLGDEFMFIVESTTTGQPIGQTGLYAWDQIARECELGRLMAAPSKVPPGQITQGIMAICDWGFRRLRVQRIRCEIFNDNVACLRVARMAGLTRFGESDELAMYELMPEKGLRPDSKLVAHGGSA